MEHDQPPRVAPSLAPEHDWAAASRLVRPALRPVGTTGTDGRELRVPHSSAGPGKTVVKAGPAGLPIVYILPGVGFDVVVGVDHLLAWGVGPDQVHAAALANLDAWSVSASWVDEANGQRKLVWSDWGEGMDAARILLEEVRSRLASDLAPARRILVGLPEPVISGDVLPHRPYAAQQGVARQQGQPVRRSVAANADSVWPAGKANPAP